MCAPGVNPAVDQQRRPRIQADIARECPHGTRGCDVSDESQDGLEGPPLPPHSSPPRQKGSNGFALAALVLGIVAGGALLIYVWLLVELGDPAEPNDTLSSTLQVPASAFKDGDLELIVAVNEAAASDPKPRKPLEIDVSISVPKQLVDSRRAPSASLIVPKSEVLRLVPGLVADGLVRFELSWVPGPCREACVHTAHLAVVGTRNLPPDTTWDVSAEIVYEPREDSEPENAGLVLGLREDGNPELITSNTVGELFPGRGVLLTAAKSQAHQSLELEVPRSAIPVESGTDVVTAELVWKGGALQTLAATPETVARVVLRPERLDEIVVSVEGNLPVDVVDGTADVRFEVPFVVTCDQERCFAGLEAQFQLLKGPWLVLDWSNYIPGMRTRMGDVWVRGWHLRAVDA